MFKRGKIGLDQSIPYHIINKTVEGREIYVEEEDCFRSAFQMYAANIGKPAHNLSNRDAIKAGQALLNGEEIPKKFIITEHQHLVTFLSFVFVVNHNHFILVPNGKNAIPKYQQNLKTGFSMYFNLKHNRHGNLFAKPYKIVPIQTHFQLDAVLRYVNVKNVIDVYQPGWREKGLKNWQEAFKFIEKYQFSSFPDVFGERNSKILTPQKVLEKYLGKEISKNKEEYVNFIKDYLQRQMTDLYPFFLEEK